MDVIFYLLMSCGQISLVSTYVDRLFIYVVRTNDLSVSCGEITYLCHVALIYVMYNFLLDILSFY